MSDQTFDKKHIALAQLETALRLYFEGEDFFSVITLSGASEEIFGKILSARGVENSLEAKKKAVAAIHLRLYGEELAPKDVADRANRARNAMKHPSPTITMDAKEEARDKLNAAIDNYWLLEQWLTPLMERFQRESMQA